MSSTSKSANTYVVKDVKEKANPPKTKKGPSSQKAASTSAAPKTYTRSLREKVLAKSAQAVSVSSMSHEESETLEAVIERVEAQHPLETQMGPQEKVEMWKQGEEDLPPRPIQSEDEEGSMVSASDSILSDVSKLSGHLRSGRKSLLLTTCRGTGIEMDAANKAANTMLLKGKEALEQAGNMKKECKLIALDSLQSLYETVLSLSDSRSRHKYNLEKERSRHAQELVRIERAHSREITKLTEALLQTRQQVEDTHKEAKDIRQWLEFETVEPHRHIAELSKATKELDSKFNKLTDTVQTYCKNDTTGAQLEPLSSKLRGIEANMKQVQEQLDELRRATNKIEEKTSTVGQTLLQHLSSEPTQAPPNHPQLEEELKSLSNKLEDLSSKITLAHNTPMAPPRVEIGEHLKPITERLKSVSSDLKTLKEQKEKEAPPPSISLGAEMALAEMIKTQASAKPTYVQAAAKKPPTPPRRPNHSLIISSADKTHTSETIVKTLRSVICPKTTGARVDRVKKVKNQKVILTCNNKEDLAKIKSKIDKSQTLKSEEARTNNPLIIIRDVMAYHTDSELVEHILAQNRQILEGVEVKERIIKVRYRKRARNALECHPVLEVSPPLHKNILEAGKLYIDLQRRPVADQSPLRAPKYPTFAKVAPTSPTPSVDTSTKIKIIQANLQRSQLATAELLQVAQDRGISIALVQEPYVGSTGILKQHPGTRVIQCTLNRRKPNKAAVIVFGDNLEVIHDPQLVTETEAAVLIVAGTLKLGIISLYYEGDQEIEPYINRTKSLIGKLKTTHNIVAGDVNAWSHWWGSSSEDPRGAAYSSFLDQMDLHILNTGDTPTFETNRRGRLYTSIVDVTACSQPLLGKLEDWRVNRSLTTSDHNAITFTLRVEGTLKPLTPQTTRIYNTKKANWSDFTLQLKTSLAEKNITPQTIEGIITPSSLESILESYITTIKDTCDKTIPKVGSNKRNPTPPWWTQSLGQLKQEVLRKKRRIRNAAPIRRQHVIDEYQCAKNIYKTKAEEAQTSSWKEFCKSQEKESMWDGIYRVIRKTARRQDDTLLRNTAGETLSPEDSAELLGKTFYPDDTTNTDSPYHTQLRAITSSNQHRETSHNIPDDPPFTMAELDTVLSTLNPKKAPGPDGLTADICTAAITCGKELFLAIANKCLSLEYFPIPWKKAHVIILRKPGKEDYTHPKSYRPIGLLAVFGKIVEKLMIRRTLWHIQPTLNNNQYGFMPGRGTEDALYNLVDHIREEIKQKKIVLLISLDIEGAFDNAWWPALKHQLGRKKCPNNIYNMIGSYLQDRKITVNYARATYTKGTTKGCVQGSIGGPTFWNIILDSLLHQLTSEGTYCQAFADDVVLLFSDHSSTTIQHQANQTLQSVVEWGQQNKLHFAAHKTSAMVLTKKLKFDPPQIYMSGKAISLVEEVKILGLIINRPLTFTTHVAATCKKAADIYKQLACAAKVTWGLNSEIIRTIYIAVIEPIILYASSVWAPATELNKVQDTLNSIQRGFALKICKAYRTVSLTSALALTGILPIDLRIQEAASFYKTKKGLSQDYIPPGKELEHGTGNLRPLHPSKLPPIKFELLEDMEPHTITTHQITGPQIYTDGSKIEGKTGAALTWWEKGKETHNSIFSLGCFCTVFQAELFALHKAIEMANTSKEPVVNILSDSRSSLELLQSSTTTSTLATTIKQHIAEATAEGRAIRLFWLRAHAGTPGNERADELAKLGALSKNQHTQPVDYDKVPLSFARRKIREESVRKWQDRYNSSTTGATTKRFLPEVNTAYRFNRETPITPIHVQAFTGHGGIAEYLHRFKLKSSPDCECEEGAIETVWHIILECPRFLAHRTELEIKLGIKLTSTNLPSLLHQKETGRPFLDYIEKIFKVAHRRNSSEEGGASSHPTLNSQPPPLQVTELPPTSNLQTNLTTSITKLLREGQPGAPGLRTRNVVLFMNTNYERLGIGFCYSSGPNRVAISPGVALQLKGSTTKTTIKRKRFDALGELEVAGLHTRVARTNNKTILLFDRIADITQFTQACQLLLTIAQTSDPTTNTPRIISVDSMVIGFDRGQAAEYLGCVEASKHHEVVVYEGRGQNLNFLKTNTQQSAPTPPSPQQPTASSSALSGSEILQQKLEKSLAATKPTITTTPIPTYLKFLPVTLGAALYRAPQALRQKLLPGRPSISSYYNINQSPHHPIPQPINQPTAPTNIRTRAQMGQIQAPRLIKVVNKVDHMVNSFIEYVAILQATKTLKTAACKKILELPQYKSEQLVKDMLEEHEATIYNNDTHQVIQGVPMTQHMAAYNATAGIVFLDEIESRQGTTSYQTPPEDPIVVTTKDTKIWLEDRILEKASSLTQEDPYNNWELPTITWVNGVPGCGKTTWIINNFNQQTDIITTTTTESKNELRERISQRQGAEAAERIRTMASILANGVKDQDRSSCSRIIVDEALMNHFGSIIMVVRQLKATQLLLIGDINQLPYIDRDNLFKLHYYRPYHLTPITKELLCTHRCPVDVAYAMQEIYTGVYSSSKVIKSLHISSFRGAEIPKNQPNTLYLTNTQVEKETLKHQGYGKGEGSKVLTVHEAQGLQQPSVIMVRMSTRDIKIYQSVPHAVVALSRHTKSLVYYTDGADDALSTLMKKAIRQTPTEITEYNTKMAILNRDNNIISQLINKIGPHQQLNQ
ncbi:uncharacterized protein LOC142986010 [Anticarsia gemmatalis]|uniref:uncharacterized protein LOC142986010 n=1 Tax=Anticarsia gemmatalis TaxID=129554 RepID=UPI003F75885F